MEIGLNRGVSLLEKSTLSAAAAVPRADATVTPPAAPDPVLPPAATPRHRRRSSSGTFIGILVLLLAAAAGVGNLGIAVVQQLFQRRLCLAWERTQRLKVEERLTNDRRIIAAEVLDQGGPVKIRRCRHP